MKEYLKSLWQVSKTTLKVLLVLVILEVCLYGGWQAYRWKKWVDTSNYYLYVGAQDTVSYLKWLIETGRLPPPKSR